MSQPHHATIAIALCGSAQKYSQSFDGLQKVAHERNERLRSRSVAAALPGGARERSPGHPCLRYRFYRLHYVEKTKTMQLTANEVDGEPAGPLPSSSVRDVDIDAVIHKVHTLGTPSAVKALERWCKRTNRARAKHHRPALLVVDPLAKVTFLSSRSLVYQLLDSDGDKQGQPVALIPRTFTWAVPRSDGEGGAVCTPIGIHSFVVFNGEEQRKRRACGVPGERWWIVKPDEGTGPSYTHHHVLFKTREMEPIIPPAVRAALPREPSAFIVQEFYAYALPIVVKVYCVYPRVFIKVNPTVKLLSQLATQEAHDAPIPVDSQDRQHFSGNGLSIATSGGYVSSASSEEGTPLMQVTPPELWRQFFAEGTTAHATIARLAEDLAEESKGFGLTLFGFDVLLVPWHLAHSYQQEAYPHGMGVDTASVPRTDANSSSDAERGLSGVTNALGLGYAPSALFDLESGTPRPLLSCSIPIVIDVNYFPGYTGMATANDDILNAVAHQHSELTGHACQEGGGGLTAKRHSKKTFCVLI